MLWVRISTRARCTILCDKVCQWLATSRWFSPVSSTNKTDRHDITEILFKVALSTIKQTNSRLFNILYHESMVIEDIFEIIYNISHDQVVGIIYTCCLDADASYLIRQSNYWTLHKTIWYNCIWWDLFLNMRQIAWFLLLPYYFTNETSLTNLYCADKSTRRVPHVEQELLTFSEHPNSFRFLVGLLLSDLSFSI